MTQPVLLNKCESQPVTQHIPLTMGKISFNGVYQAKEPGSVELSRYFSVSVYEQDDVRLLVVRVHSEVKFPTLEGILSGASPVTDYIKNAIDYTVTPDGHTVLRFIADKTAPEETDILAVYDDVQVPVMQWDILDLTMRVMADLGFDVMTQFAVRALVNRSTDALLLGNNVSNVEAGEAHSEESGD